jgi:uncharacterized protein YfaP (DUF2135 family)
MSILFQRPFIFKSGGFSVALQSGDAKCFHSLHFQAYMWEAKNPTQIRVSVTQHAGLRIKTNHKLMKPELVWMLNGEV